MSLCFKASFRCLAHFEERHNNLLKTMVHFECKFNLKFWCNVVCERNAGVYNRMITFKSMHDLKTSLSCYKVLERDGAYIRSWEGM